jgi:serine/threonine-protein kinase
VRTVAACGENLPRVIAENDRSMTLATDQRLPDLRRVLMGRYEIERPLARGGMGMVYLGHDVQLERPVAIKVLLPERARQSTARARFLQEARTAARLVHPHIVPIHSVHETDGFVYFVMTYIEGETLGQRLRRGPLAPREATWVLRDVASALAHAHAEGVVHRDVKPDNILLAAATGRAYVTDFGIARLRASHVVSGPDEILGTAEFMSPEQVRGDPLGPRSDVYALGVVAFYMLAGRLPFSGEDPYHVMQQHLDEPAPPLAAMAPWVPGPLATAIDRCLNKDPAARWSSADELGAVVQRATGDGPQPLAVRAFFTESRQLAVVARAYGALAGLVGVPLLSVVFVDPALASLRAAAVSLILGAAVVPFAVAVRRARRLLRAGHRRVDVVAGLHTELTRRQEELAFLYGDGPSPVERALRWVCYVGVAVAATVVGAVSLGALTDTRVLTAATAAAATALAAAALARARAERRSDPWTERRLRVWSGAIGRLVFRTAELGVRRPVRGLRPISVAQRPQERHDRQLIHGRETQVT